MRRLAATALACLFIFTLTACTPAIRNTDGYKTEVNGTLYTMDAILRSDTLTLELLMGSHSGTMQENGEAPEITKNGVAGNVEGFSGSLSLYSLKALSGAGGTLSFTCEASVTGDLRIALASLSDEELLAVIPLQEGPTAIELEIPSGFTSVVLLADNVTGQFTISGIAPSENLTLSVH